MEKVELELWNRTRYRFRNVAFYRKESVWGKNARERNIYWGIYRWEKRNEKVALENGIVFPAYKRCFCTVRSNEYGPIGRKILEKDRGKASLPRGTRRNIAGKTNKGSRKLKRLWNRIGILSSAARNRVFLEIFFQLDEFRKLARCSTARIICIMHDAHEEQALSRAWFSRFHFSIAGGIPLSQVSHGEILLCIVDRIGKNLNSQDLLWRARSNKIIDIAIDVWRVLLPNDEWVFFFFF